MVFQSYEFQGCYQNNSLCINSKYISHHTCRNYTLIHQTNEQSIATVGIYEYHLAPGDDVQIAIGDVLGFSIRGMAIVSVSDFGLNDGTDSEQMVHIITTDTIEDQLYSTVMSVHFRVRYQGIYWHSKYQNWGDTLETVLAGVTNNGLPGKKYVFCLFFDGGAKGAA